MAGNVGGGWVARTWTPIPSFGAAAPFKKMSRYLKLGRSRGGRTIPARSV